MKLFKPGFYDALNVLQTQVTKTATFQSTGVDLKTGTPRRGQIARFIISAYGSGATAGATFVCSIEESDDNTTFTTVGAAPTFTGGTANTTREVFVPFATIKRYIRPVVTVSSTTAHTPTIAYLVDLGVARP